MKNLHTLKEFPVNCRGDSKGNLSALSSHEGFHLDPNTVLDLRSDAPSIKPELEETVIFFGNFMSL